MNGIRWKRLVDVFTQIVPKSTLNKQIHFVRGDGSLFAKQKPSSFDRVRPGTSMFLIRLQIDRTKRFHCRCLSMFHVPVIDIL